VKVIIHLMWKLLLLLLLLPLAAAAVVVLQGPLFINKIIKYRIKTTSFDLCIWLGI